MLIRCNARSIRLTIAHYVIMYIPNKGEFQDFLKLYKDYTKEPRTILIFSERLQVCHQIIYYYKMAIAEKIKTIESKIEQTKFSTI